MSQRRDGNQPQSLRYDYTTSSESLEDEDMPTVTRTVLADSLEETSIEGITGPDILEVRKTPRPTLWDCLRRWFLNCAICCPCLYSKYQRL